jgi:Ca-activated chloride channel homolog
MPKRFLPRFTFAFLACGLGLGALPARAQEQPATVIVFDSSGSMWGNLGKKRKSKFDLARAALRQSLTQADPRSRLGLVAFGHRRRGDCSDAEVLLPPAKGEALNIPDIVDKFNPKGRGPLTLALKAAAKTLAPGEPGSILLIHDGPDNCNADPCVAATEIAQSNPGVPVHIVSVALNRLEASRMKCVSKATRGKMFEANDAESLQAALDEAFQLAKLVLPKTPAKNAGTAKPDTSAQARPGLRLTASLSANGAPLAAPISWTVRNEKSPETIVDERTASALTLETPPGRYLVTARYGAANSNQTIEVSEKGPTTERLSFDAGLVKIAAGADQVPNLLDAPMVSLYSAAPDSGAGPKPQRPIWLGRLPVEIVVPAGNYTVRLEDGLLVRETGVTVEAGKRSQATLLLRTGRLELEAAAHDGGQPLSNVIYTINEDDPDAPQGRREIARSAHPNAAFVLPAGTYYVTAKHGNAEAYERIAIGTGDNIKSTLVFNLGRLSVSALLDGAPPPATASISFQIFKLDQPEHEMARSRGATGKFLLPEGRYRIEARTGTLNVKDAVETKIGAGRAHKIQLKLETAQIIVSPPTGSTSRETSWEVKDQRGRTVLRSSQTGATSATVAPGQYRLRSKIGERRSEESIDLKPGDKHTFEIAPK